jgi:putative PIG3 family NAD(P)H quinone oxidoreductase
MRAVLTDGAGGPEIMRLGEAPIPEPGAGQVRLRVAATAVNRADLWQRMGKYPPPPGDSEILGLECAGVIDALGPDVGDWRVGDAAMTIVGGGGYAEYCLAPAATLMPVPDGLDLVQAAAIPEVFLTAFLNLFREGGLKDGETALLHSGASGVGTAAIQLIRELRPHSGVFVTVGSSAKADACRQLGAEAAILYKEQDFAARVLELTDGRGVDVILDHIGGPYLAKNLACLALYGRLVIIGVTAGAKAEFDIATFMRKRQRIVGSVLRARPVEEKAALARSFVEEALPLFAQGRLRPVVHKVLPLVDVRAAHELVAADANIGKVLLAVNPDLTPAAA